MSGSPDWKVYDHEGQYEAACKHPEIAAAVVSVLGEGATVRYRHGRILWREGAEEMPAGESYDGAALTMIGRR